MKKPAQVIQAGLRGLGSASRAVCACCHAASRSRRSLWEYGRALDEFVVLEDSKSQERSTAARLFFACVQLVKCALQFFKLLSSLAQFAFRCQALVVGKVFGGFGDEHVEIRCGLGRRGGW